MSKLKWLVVVAVGFSGVIRAEDAWIQTDGTQYIDTGFKPTPKTKIVADYAYTAVTPVQQRVFGVTGGTSGLVVTYYINGSGDYAWAMQDDDGNWQGTGIKATTDRRRCTLDGPGNLAKLETWQAGGTWADSKNQAISTPRTKDGRRNLFLFIEANNGDYKNFGKLKLYGLQIYENGVLVRDYQPRRYGTRGALLEAVSGIIVTPDAGNALAAGGDIVTIAEPAYVWSGANGTAWDDAGNWSAGGSPATQVPPVGTAFTVDTGVGGTKTISCAGMTRIFPSITVTGSGTLVLTDVPNRRIVQNLVLSDGAKVSVAGGATLYAGAVTVGGNAVANAGYGDSAAWVNSGFVNVNHCSATIVGSELLLEAGSSDIITYSTQLSASLTKVIKTGPGRIIISNDSNASFTGVTEVRGGILEVRSDKVGIIPTLGDKKENTITVFDGAQLYLCFPTGQHQETKHFNNQFVIAGYGPNGMGAVRFERSREAGSGNCDSLMSNVRLAGDALVSSVNCRFGFGNADVDLCGHTLDLYPMSNAGFMLNGGTWQNGNAHFCSNMNPVFQNENHLTGGAGNMMTIESGTMLGFWNAPLTFDWTLRACAGTKLSIGSGSADDRNNIAGPVLLEGGTIYLRTYTSTAGMRQHLKGKISGDGKLRKENDHYVFLDNPANDWTGGLQLSGTANATTVGALVATYPGSVPAASAVTLSSGVLAYDPANWTDGDVKALAERATYNGSGGGFVAPYTNATLAATFTLPVHIGAANGKTLNFTGRLANGSVLRNVGGTLNVTGDNNGTEPGGFGLHGGTTTFKNTGVMDFGNRECRIGGDATLARVTVDDGAVLTRPVPASASTTSAINVYGAGSSPGAVLRVLPGGAITNKIQIGSEENTRGAFYVDGGSVYNICRDNNDGFTGCNGNAYGFTGVYGGLYKLRGWHGFGHNSGSFGVFEQTGGEVVPGDGFCISRGGMARAHLSGGLFNQTTDSIRLGEQQWSDKGATKKTAVLTIDGTADVRSLWINITERINEFTSVVNFNGGLFTGGYIRKSNWEAGKRVEASKGYVNFNGGTFKGTETSSSYFDIFGWSPYCCDEVRIFERGATIDTNGKNLSNGAVTLRAPTGKGVKSVAMPSGIATTGYIGAPVVTIEGDGAGATAWCEFNHETGAIGPIVVTSPGWGYTTATAKIRLSDRTTDLTCAVTLADNVTTGGLTVKGGGNFMLKQANTYGGSTFVTNATLVLGWAGSIPSGSDLVLAEGTLDMSGNSQTVKSVGGTGTVKNGGTLTISGNLVFDAATAQDKSTQLEFLSPVVFDGDVVIKNTDALDQGAGAGVLCTFATPLAKAPAVNVPAPWRAYLTNGGRTLKFGYLHATTLILR